MRFKNTKNNLKDIGTDVKDVGKASWKLVKDTFKTPSSIFADIRQHRAVVKLGYELLAKQEAEASQQNPQ